MILQILFTLLDPALVAGLVLGTTQLVRAGMAEGLGVDIAGIAPDGVLDMAALRLGRLQDPLLARRVGQEVGELEGEEQAQLLGEALPIGLRLVRPAEGEGDSA